MILHIVSSNFVPWLTLYCRFPTDTKTTITRYILGHTCLNSKKFPEEIPPYPSLPITDYCILLDSPERGVLCYELLANIAVTQLGIEPSPLQVTVCIITPMGFQTVCSNTLTTGNPLKQLFSIKHPKKWFCDKHPSNNCPLSNKLPYNNIR